MSQKSVKKSKSKKSRAVDEAVDVATIEVSESDVSAMEASSEQEGSPSAQVSELNLEFADDDADALEFTSADDSEREDAGNELDAALADESTFEAESEREALSDDGGLELQMSSDASAEDELGEETTGEDGTEEVADDSHALDDTELGAFESAQIEDIEMISAGEIRSVVESVLFMTDKPISIAVIKQTFKGTNVKSKDIREALQELSKDYAESNRGFTLDEIAGGFQLRTKAENLKYLRQGVKARPFKLSGPALEVLSIVAYKQPTTKHQIDEIRGVESGHLLRALMEKHLLTFGERSDLPGKPMFYETTRKFLEIFSLRNLQELPSLHEIDQLIPEGIGDEHEKKKETLSDLTGQLSQEVASSYSVGEEELLKITDELSTITTSSDFFEQEKERMRQKRDEDRAQNLREALTVGETIDEKDRRWLERFDAAKTAAVADNGEVDFVTEGLEAGMEDSATESDSAEPVSADHVASGEMADAAFTDQSEDFAEIEAPNPHREPAQEL